MQLLPMEVPIETLSLNISQSMGLKCHPEKNFKVAEVRSGTENFKKFSQLGRYFFRKVRHDHPAWSLETKNPFDSHKNYNVSNNNQ